MSFFQRLIWTVRCDGCGAQEEVQGDRGYGPVFDHLRSLGWALTPRQASHLLDDVHALCPDCVKKAAA